MSDCCASHKPYNFTHFPAQVETFVFSVKKPGYGVDLQNHKGKVEWAGRKKVSIKGTLFEFINAKLNNHSPLK